MVAGTGTGSLELRAWSLLVGILAAGLGVVAAIYHAAEAVKVYVRKWSHETFEAGFKGGIAVGREMEAAEQFIASAVTPHQN